MKNPRKKIIARTPWSLIEGRKDKDIIPKQWIKIKGNPHPPCPSFTPDNL